MACTLHRGSGPLSCESHLRTDPSAQVVELAGLHAEVQRFPPAAGRTAGLMVADGSGCAYGPPDGSCRWEPAAGGSPRSRPHTPKAPDRTADRSPGRSTRSLSGAPGCGWAPAPPRSTSWSGPWALGTGAARLPGSATGARCGPRLIVRRCPTSPSCTSLRGRGPSAPARARPSRVAPEGWWPSWPRRRDWGRARRRGRHGWSRLGSRPRSAAAAGSTGSRAPAQPRRP
jgi:hypothetical protein